MILEGLPLHPLTQVVTYISSRIDGFVKAEVSYLHDVDRGYQPWESAAHDCFVLKSGSVDISSSNSGGTVWRELDPEI